MDIKEDKINFKKETILVSSVKDTLMNQSKMSVHQDTK